MSTNEKIATINNGPGRFGIDVEVIHEHDEVWVIVRQDNLEVSVRPERVRDLADALNAAADQAEGVQ